MNSDESDYKLHEFVAHNTNVNCLTFGPQSAQVVATGGEDCKVNIWRVDNTANIWSLGHNKYPVECLNFDAEEQYLVSGARNGSIKVFDLNAGKLARNLNGHPTNVSSVNYHPYGEFIVSGSIDNTMKVWDVRSKMCIQTYTGHENAVTCVRFSPDGRWVASSGKDGQFLVWDLVAGKLIQTIRTKNNYLKSFEFNPAEFLLAGASSDKTVKFWDLETFERVGRTPPSKQAVTSVAFSENGASLCAASNGSLKVWNWDPEIESKATVSSIGWENVYEMRVAPNTTQLIAGSFVSNFVSIYSVDLGELLDSRNEDEDEDASVEDETVRFESTPDKLNESLAKEVQDEESPDEKWGDDYENDFEDEVKLDKLDLGEEKDSKANSGPGVEWDSGITPRDLATSMGESFLAKLKEDERKARSSDCPKSPRVRPPSTAQRHRNPPKRPTSTDSPTPKAEYRRPGTNSAVRKPSNRYGGIENGGSDIEGLEIIGSKHMNRESSGGMSSAHGGMSVIGPGGYRYAVENNNEIGGSRQEEKEKDRDRGAYRKCASPRGRESEEKHESHLHPTESSSAPKEKNIAEALDALIDKSGEVLSVLSQRLTNLRLLNQYWEKGEISVIIDHLRTIQMTGKHDPNGCVALADFFSSVDLKASHIVTLDVCAKILPILNAMLDVGLEEISMASLVAVISLAESYGPLIADTRGIVVRQVDISREERIEKCNACHKEFSLILNKFDNLKKKYGENSLFRGVIDRTQSLLLNIV